MTRILRMKGSKIGGSGGDIYWDASSGSFTYWYAQIGRGASQETKGGKTLRFVVDQLVPKIEDVTLLFEDFEVAWRIRGQWFYKPDCFFEKSFGRGLPVIDDAQGFYVRGAPDTRAPRPALACAYWVSQHAQRKLQQPLLSESFTDLAWIQGRLYEYSIETDPSEFDIEAVGSYHEAIRETKQRLEALEKQLGDR